jgi:hypothetical protein
VSPQITDGLSEQPIAKLGYQYFQPPQWWENLPTDIRAGDRWFVHTSAASAVPATVERLVGGYAGCQAAIGVLLAVAPEHLKATSGRYFVATTTPPSPQSSPTSVRALGEALTSDLRKNLESTLEQLMVGELPRVRAEAAPHLTRSAVEAPYGSQRTWAKQRLQIEQDMQAGRGKLQYDAQGFQLAPDGTPVYFVRAEWLVGRRQGFALTMWARTANRQFQVIETDMKPASWMRIPLFPSVQRVHLGLILNVFDRDRDGWGEVLASQQGYESGVITLLEYSPNGFKQTGVEFAGGC